YTLKDDLADNKDLETKLLKELPEKDLALLKTWDSMQEEYAQDEYIYHVRGKEFRQPLTHTSLSGTRIRRVVPPRLTDWGDRLRFLRLENVPGQFPYTAGVFPLKRVGEDPTRMFAGEGTPERTNKRFHYLSKDALAKRLSTAFDSVTLYGFDPHERPDIYGKVGESGVSICTLNDMKKLFAGFDLCSPSTSVSMTINGPAPMILAFYFNTAIDQQVELKEKELGRKLKSDELDQLKDETLQKVRGTVQADILKEDQGQNTCIFSIDFALKMMGDIQEYFVGKKIRNFYSVSISGYHIAEAGANPISQVAFTLSNAFTFVEYYLARGMKIDDFAPNLSFFFSNGMDPEYSVIGRVARRIWAVALRDIYKGSERSQKLKYHIQTSGRSLHAQEIDFNDIRTTLQALLAIYDNCNSLHTNAYDEAITTPTEESVRRAMAIQMIINKEFGVAKNENPNQGSYFLQELTELVEEAILAEFMRINERGGVLGAMETQYQRGKIQEESMYYEHLKHSGDLPIIGVNQFIDPKTLQEGYVPEKIELARASKQEKDQQLHNRMAYQELNSGQATQELEKLKQAALKGENIFAALMSAARVCSLHQMTDALFEVGGQYRRNL
ncbi:MAG: methylmalonyl-CoA mutase, partial [Bdellovibrionales bacterium]|nr:methylmalonyl-CoA mutase [Bdellovibrionales bacterium]